MLLLCKSNQKHFASESPHSLCTQPTKLQYDGLFNFEKKKNCYVTSIYKIYILHAILVACWKLVPSSHASIRLVCLSICLLQRCCFFPSFILSILFSGCFNSFVSHRIYAECIRQWKHVIWPFWVKEICHKHTFTFLHTVFESVCFFRRRCVSFDFINISFHSGIFYHFRRSYHFQLKVFTGLSMVFRFPIGKCYLANKKKADQSISTMNSSFDNW